MELMHRIQRGVLSVDLRSKILRLSGSRLLSRIVWLFGVSRVVWTGFQDFNLRFLLSLNTSLSTHFVPGTVWGTRDPKVNDIQLDTGLKKLTLMEKTNVVFKSIVYIHVLTLIHVGKVLWGHEMQAIHPGSIAEKGGLWVGLEGQKWGFPREIREG